MKLFGWFRRADTVPDTLRTPPHFEREVLDQLRELRKGQEQMQEMQLATTKSIEALRLALIEDGRTLGEHLDSHAKDARREHLRSVKTLSEEA